MNFLKDELRFTRQEFLVICVLGTIWAWILYVIFGFPHVVEGFALNGFLFSGLLSCWLSLYAAILIKLFDESVMYFEMMERRMWMFDFKFTKLMNGSWRRSSAGELDMEMLRKLGRKEEHPLRDFVIRSVMRLLHVLTLVFLGIFWVSLLRHFYVSVSAFGLFFSAAMMYFFHGFLHELWLVEEYERDM